MTANVKSQLVGLSRFAGLELSDLTAASTADPSCLDVRNAKVRVLEIRFILLLAYQSLYAVAYGLHLLRVYSQAIMRSLVDPGHGLMIVFDGRSLTPNSTTQMPKPI